MYAISPSHIHRWLAQSACTGRAGNTSADSIGVDMIFRATYQLHHLQRINWPQEILIKFFCLQNGTTCAIRDASFMHSAHASRSPGHLSRLSSSHQSLYLPSDAVLIETVCRLGVCLCVFCPRRWWWSWPTIDRLAHWSENKEERESPANKWKVFLTQHRSATSFACAVFHSTTIYNAFHSPFFWWNSAAVAAASAAAG